MSKWYSRQYEYIVNAKEETPKYNYLNFLKTVQNGFVKCNHVSINSAELEKLTVNFNKV